MFILHHHDEYSTFDGFGKASELAKLAKELGYTSLSTTNHGNVNGLIRTYQACKDEGIKAILGIEGYFIPKYKPQHRGYHLVLIAKNLEGYGNINRIQRAGEEQKYYNSIWDFELLERYHNGIICTTACVAGFLGQMVKKGKIEVAKKFLRRMVSIFGDDFYIEIQPYVVSEEGFQERINVTSIELAKELGIKCILTSDSHYGRKEDFETYLKMHEIAGHDLSDIEETYKERYTPEMGDMYDRFCKMHKKDFGKAASKIARRMYENLEEIEAKCELNYLDELEMKLPTTGEIEEEPYRKIKKKVKFGLQKKNKWNSDYISRVKEELEIIEYHGFSDYFLIVADYVNWAKNEGIVVGPGRGSVCNSLVAYALGITEVDSLLFDLDFRRFLRKDKKKLPDIDLDFETSRRQEVIDYICKKYEGHAGRICSYGLYKVDNLINDLAKVCGLAIDKNDELKEEKKRIIKNIKSIASENVTEEGTINELMLDSDEVKDINEQYDNILLHFYKLFNRVRFIGTHAAGVAITGGKLIDYVCLRLDKNRNEFTSYNLMDAEAINIVKFDILGLKTMESIGELRRITKTICNYDEIVKDKKIIEQFRNGNCDGVFQFERGTPRKIMDKISADCFEDIAATTAMNRPGPLQMGMPEVYAEGKMDSRKAMKSIHWEYTKETYGTIVYQEQLQQICLGIGDMEWSDADKMMKLMKGNESSEQQLREYNENKKILKKSFMRGAIKNGVEKNEASDLFENMVVYSFNKGHAVGYTLISFEEMFYKVYYPNEYWFVKMKYAKDEQEYGRFCSKAVNDGSLIFLPHINYSKSLDSLRKFEGQKVIQQGLSSIKGVGEKAALSIEYMRRNDGDFIDYPDFEERRLDLPKEMRRTITSATVSKLKEAGAFEFDEENYIKRTVRYCSAMKGRNYSTK